MTKDEALEMAIEALNDSLTRFSTFNEMQHDAIQACIEALEQPSWQGLSEYDILSIDGLECVNENHLINFASAIEQALKDKNT
jgi:hypothetical protein